MAQRIVEEALHQSYAQLAELIGTDAMAKVYEMYRGRQISFPMRLYDREKVAERIVDEYDGNNLTELTKKYDYSQRWIRKILKDQKEA